MTECVFCEDGEHDGKRCTECSGTGRMPFADAKFYAAEMRGEDNEERAS